MLTPKHQVWKKLDADRFGAHLPNMKNFFLLHQHVDTQAPSVKKVARRHVRCAPPQHEKKIFFLPHQHVETWAPQTKKKYFFCHTNMLTPRHQVCKKLDIDMFFGVVRSTEK